MKFANLVSFKNLHCGCEQDSLSHCSPVLKLVENKLSVVSSRAHGISLSFFVYRGSKELVYLLVPWSLLWSWVPILWSHLQFVISSPSSTTWIQIFVYFWWYLVLCVTVIKDTTFLPSAVCPICTTSNFPIVFPSVLLLPLL